MHHTCESCGARVDAGVEVCNLCGTPMQGAAAELGTQELERTPEKVVSARAASGYPNVDDWGTVHEPECDTCGHLNPDGSRFCNRCGSRLVPSRQGNDAPPETGTGTASAASVVADQRDVAAAKDEGPSKITDLNATDKAVGKQVIIVVSAALLLVVVLYFATTMSGGSQGDFSIAAPPPDQQTVEPLASQWQEQEGQLMSEIEGAAGEAQIDARRRLIDLYFAADRLDFAADQTVLIAEAIGSEEEWVLAGNLYFDWMQRAPDAQKAPWAQKAVGSYQAALELNPDNLDVRTNMAIAYLYDPQNSMMAIQETTRVLESDSLHIQANFNRGIMLNQINRTDQAIEQFEKVKRIIGDAEDPVYQRAESAIAQLSGS